MNRSCYQLAVLTTTDGQIVITDNDHDLESTITITPEQVPLLIKWLKDSCKELADPKILSTGAQ